MDIWPNRFWVDTAGGFASREVDPATWVRRREVEKLLSRDTPAEEKAAIKATLEVFNPAENLNEAVRQLRWPL